MNRFKRRFVLWARAATLAALSFGVYAESAVKVSNAYVYAPIPGRAMTVAYWQLENHSEQSQVLVGVSLPAAAVWASSAEIHQHVHRDGMMRMQKVEQLTLAGKAQQLFESGGYHLMVFGVQKLQVGDKVPVVLHWQAGNEQQVQLEVRQR